MRSKFLYLILFFAITLIAITLIGCTDASTSSQPDLETLHVSAAASLTESFTEIGEQFEILNPNITIVFNFAGSQQLAQQINQGAPADVFASANLAQINNVSIEGNIDQTMIQTFATNRLIVIYPSDNPGGITTLQDLDKPELHLVLASEEVPVGQYAIEFLEKASHTSAYGQDFKKQVLANVVSYERDVKVVLTKIILGEADAGIVYSSDVTGENATKVGKIGIPAELNVVAAYPIAPVSTSTNPEVANAFIAFILSSEGQKILTEFGFFPVSDHE